VTDGVNDTVNDGAKVGVSVAINDGAEDGVGDTFNDGGDDGVRDKLKDGAEDSTVVGFDEATKVGRIDGICVVGLVVGLSEGFEDMTMLGALVGNEIVGPDNSGVDCMGLEDGIACSLSAVVVPELFSLLV
jgi:hypothetical protein